MNLKMVAGWLLVLGGVTLGLEGLVDYDLLGGLLGEGSMVERLVDILIGASALYLGFDMVGSKGKK